MARVKWTKYFMHKPGHAGRFAVPGIFQPVNLDNEDYPVEFIKQLYDVGVPNIMLTPEGEKKFGSPPSKAAKKLK